MAGELMAELFRAFSAVFPIIIQTHGTTQKVLLHRRMNTGYQDGKLDIAASGHVDDGETATCAAVRECKEELGIEVLASDLRFVHLSHRLGLDRTYYDIYFIVESFSGEPAIMEPEKCSELLWCDLESLPDDVIECRSQVLHEYKLGNYYSEWREKP